MFSGCTSLVSVPLFSTANVISMSNMFAGCTALTTVPNFNTANVTNMSNMFSGCTVFNSAAPASFTMTNVSNATGMFQDCTTFNQNLSGWNVPLMPTKPFAFDTNTPAWTSKSTKQPALWN